MPGPRYAGVNSRRTFVLSAPAGTSALADRDVASPLVGDADTAFAPPTRGGATLSPCTECRIVALSSEPRADWDRYVLDHPDGTLFHTLAWRDAVAETFGHEEHYLRATRGDCIVGVLPMFRVNSRFGGRMLVSVPYGVGGGILADDDEVVAALFAHARRVAEERDCCVIDLRSERALVPDLPIIDRYVGFSRELPDRPEDVLGWLPRKARAAARNACNKYKLTVSFGDKHLEEVWRLYSISMRRLASLTYPLKFFERLVSATPDRHWTCVVRWSGRTVAGLLTFLFRDRVMPYFIGTTDEAKRCSAANFIYFVTMERAVEESYRVFDFGRSRRDNTGSYDFKRFHGFEPRPLGYQCYTRPGSAPPNLTPTNPAFALARRVWPHLPLRLTQIVGCRLAKHIPG